MQIKAVLLRVLVLLVLEARAVIAHRFLTPLFLNTQVVWSRQYGKMQKRPLLYTMMENLTFVS